MAGEYRQDVREILAEVKKLRTQQEQTLALAMQHLPWLGSEARPIDCNETNNGRVQKCGASEPVARFLYHHLKTMERLVELGIRENKPFAVQQLLRVYDSYGLPYTGRRTNGPVSRTHVARQMASYLSDLADDPRKSIIYANQSYKSGPSLQFAFRSHFHATNH